MSDDQFDQQFAALTGHPPFPWQRRLYGLFCQGTKHIPESCNLPTGLGKTSVIAVWLLARQVRPELPRRLVYVVNRRTVVDQTTEEVEKYLRILDTGRKVPDEGRTPEQQAEYLKKLESARRQLAEMGFKFDGLALSTLRGQFADNAEWSRDPSKPAVICGTVDMIGSRLLFSGYGIGMGKKPLHAGFLGQDALLVHDEAHLEPAFQELLGYIEREQRRCSDFRPLRVIELTATSRGGDGAPPFGLDAEDHENITVRARLEARKELRPREVASQDKVAEGVAQWAVQHHDSGRAVLVFVTTIKDVEAVRKRLDKEKLKSQVLTGTLRGRERDALAESDPIFARFLPDPPGHAATGTVYLVCTSAGEVGVNISADHLVCDLSTFESMAQRFGRVNRFGRRDDTVIDVVHPPTDKFGEKDFLPEQRRATLALLERLDGDGSPKSLGRFTAEEREGAFAPEPVKLTATDILFDAWALTTIKGKLPGRPAVEPYLHGVTPPELAETYVAWREEVWLLRKIGENGDRKGLEKLAGELLEDFPLKPHELLQDKMARVRGALAALATLTDKHPDYPAWVVAEDGTVTVTTLGELAETQKRDGRADYAINSRYCTILLPPQAGGLSDSGMFDPKSAEADDVSCEWFVGNERDRPRRQRRFDDDEPPKEMRLVRTVALPGDGGDEDAEATLWHWFVRPNSADDDGSKTGPREPVTWQRHTDDVVQQTTDFVNRLLAGPADAELRAALILAARWHDLGKKRTIWQRSIGNPRPAEWYAKSGLDPETRRRWRPAELTAYRHEFGSVLDIGRTKFKDEWEAQFKLDFAALSSTPYLQDLVLHLIAAHHGYARPHFPAERAFDPGHPDADGLKLAAEVPARFAKLQRKYGRWGLAYLESLLRAADWAASADPSPSPGLEGEQQ